MLDSMEKEHQEKAKEWIGVVSSQTTTRTHQETSQDQFDYDFDIQKCNSSHTCETMHAHNSVQPLKSQKASALHMHHMFRRV